MGRVAVKEERCKGCGYCLNACKKEGLSLSSARRNRSGYNVATFSPESDCSGCALCAELCPEVALEVYR